MRLSLLLLCGPGLLLLSTPPADSQARPEPQTAAAELRSHIESSPRLPLRPQVVQVILPPGKKLGMVSWMAQDPRTKVLWILGRGTNLSPVLGIDPQGHVVRAFGRGAFTVPHAICLDPAGHIWTVDAGSSQVIKWSPAGERLLTITLSHPAARSGFAGATDVAFAPHGEIVVSDGYGNARLVEYTSGGQKMREWGSAGGGPGQFHLPHSLVIDQHGIIYVADRENGRIERLDLTGKFLGQFAGLGRVYALALGPRGSLWASMSPMNEPAGAPGWLVKLDRASGKLLGYVPVPEQGGLHGLAVDAAGEPLTDVGNTVFRFRTLAPAQPAR